MNFSFPSMIFGVVRAKIYVSCENNVSIMHWFFSEFRFGYKFVKLQKQKFKYRTEIR
jgi:hypothetical protein